MLSRQVKTYLGLLFLVGLLSYVYYNLDDFKIILQADLKYTLLVFLLNLIFILTIGNLQRVTLLAYKINQNLKEAFFLSIVTTFGNYFLPLRGGAGLRAVYLKKKYALRYFSFAANLIFQLLLLMQVVSFMLFFAALVMDQEFLLITSLVCFMIASLAIYRPNYFYKFLYFRYLKKFFSKFYRSWRRINFKQSYFVKCYLAFFMFYLANIVVSCFEIRALNLASSFNLSLIWHGFIISSTNLLSSVLIITPGAIGIREAMLAMVSTELPYSANDLISLSLYDRAIMMTQVFLLISVAYRFLKIRDE